MVPPPAQPHSGRLAMPESADQRRGTDARPNARRYGGGGDYKPLLEVPLPRSVRSQDAAQSSNGFDPAISAEERELILEEEAILRTVLEQLGRVAPPGESPDLSGDILELRDSLGEARPDEIAQIVNQMDNLANLSARLNADSHQRPVDLGSPYFGHLRVLQGGREIDVLIGGNAWISGSGRYPIIDWRNAPISKLYYLYGVGEEYEEEFGGKLVEGTVLAHRKLMILQGRLMRVETDSGRYQMAADHWVKLGQRSPQLEGGQGSALRPGTVASLELGVDHMGLPREDRHLPAITSLIDPRQFELITAPDSGIVVIDGGAGSGKTTIALHRIAYLNFNAPQRFQPHAIMVVVFNKALANYISGLLPVLGVEGVRIEVFEDFVSALRKRHFANLKEKYTEVTPFTVVRFKQHPASLAFLQELISEMAGDIRERLVEGVAGTKSAKKALEAWDSLEDSRLGSRLLQYTHWVAGKLILPGVGGFGKDWLAQRRLMALMQEALPDPRHPAALAQQLWEEAFIRLPRLEAAMQRLAPGEFSPSQLEEVRDWCMQAYSRREDHRALRAERKAGELEADGEEHQLEPAVLDREDDVLLLLLHGLMVGALTNRRKKPLRTQHLMIDEAQDFSPLDVRLMIDLAEEPRSVTLAGDTDQRMILHNAFDTWEDVLRHLGLEGTTVSPLRVGYRSTEEIMDFSKRVLGPLATERPWTATRSGAPVQLLRFTDQGQAISVLSEALHGLLRREPDAYVALIARYAGQADVYYQGLAFTDLIRLRRVADQNFSFQRGIDVTDIYQVKGLEFDYVILLDVDRYSYPDDVAARYLLHIGATRAAHQLWLVACDVPSPLLPSQLTQQVL